MFTIEKGLQEEYVLDFKSHMMNLMQRGFPEDGSMATLNKEAIRYFKEKEIDFLGFETGFDGCYSFTIDKINKMYGFDIPNPYQGYWFADNMTKLLHGDQKTFQPISSLDELKHGQVIVYKNPDDTGYLHAGITEMSDSGIKVLSQWGEGNAPSLRHPIGRVDKSYGTHYQVFNVNTD